MLWMGLWLILGAGCVGSQADRSAPDDAAAPPAPAEVDAPSPAPPPVSELPDPSEARYAASHILVAHRGAVDAEADRSEAQARALAEELRERAEQEDFATLARDHSDGASAARGGALGVYATGTMVPDFEKAVASVEVGQLGPLVHTPFGWHVVRRDAVVEARAAHILVPFAGAWRSKATRSRDEARARIQEARAALADDDFGSVAEAYSEGPTASAGGDLGLVAPGQMVPAFEAALFALKPGEVSEPVETPYGFHLIHRSE